MSAACFSLGKAREKWKAPSWAGLSEWEWGFNVLSAIHGDRTYRTLVRIRSFY